MTRAALLLLLTVLPALAACGGGGSEPEPPAPVEAEPIEPVSTDDPPSIPVPEAEPEPEPEPSYMELGDAAASRGDLAQARRLYGEAATEAGVTDEAFAYAELKIALLYLLLPDEPDFEAARLRLDRAVESSPETMRLEVEGVLLLLNEIQDRDETVRRLTELIGNER